MMRVSIVQSAYIPWKGFFDLLSRCDVHIIYDTSAFSKGHWHNRNRIKRAAGSPWLTIPVATSERLGQPLEDVLISGAWAERHWALIREAYGCAPYFRETEQAMLPLYEELASEPRLSVVNERLLRSVVGTLGLRTEIRRDREFAFEGDRTERLVALCQAVGATHYLSGPSARAYLDAAAMARAGIEVEWMEYGPYPEYPQPHGAFADGVSVLDVMFCVGPEAGRMIVPRA